MTLEENEIHRERLFNIGAVDKNTTWVITHFSHNGLFENERAVSAERMEEIAQSKNMISAYDGMEIKI